MIRELIPEDAAQFKELRQRAVEVSEGGFAIALDDWVNRSISEIQEMLQQEQDSLNDFILGAFVDNKLVGMIGFFRPTKPKLGQKGHIWGTFMSPEWRGQRLAGKLLDELIARARRLPRVTQLQLTTTNQYKAAISLYRSRGFRIIATESQVIRAGENIYDELYMTMNL
ncbi:MAG: GNAT family N-acetyltransferase [Chloroflexi bacterium]|nr:MAG: GNAT family N-acetyltransferase [Chloroflexota bacterium]